jgi:hypothetical protein
MVDDRFIRGCWSITGAGLLPRDDALSSELIFRRITARDLDFLLIDLNLFTPPLGEGD